MTRWKAAGTHLALSVIVIGGIAAAAFFLWYPMGLYRLAGHDRILLLMLGIDLAAGPLLTLIVYKAGKKSLPFDLSVIAVAQLAFLGFGLHTLWQTRPVFLLAQPDRYTLVFANELDPDALSEAPRAEWRRLSWTGPQLVATRMPTDPLQRSHVMSALFAGGTGIERSPRWYFEYAEIANEIARRSRRLDEGPDIPPDVLEGTGVPAIHLRWHPVASRFSQARMLIDARDGSPIRVVTP